ncbi:hypothetical protein [Pseudalkalibacillus berkeleyi]|uniref:Uncharacterized protein n=1 Tax=Pseudalkalibacillus berkeleyi TaxID=1069813 RepID=A0ABS9GY76_9BACL|nr:hypothetical protein [Pseudalkalibacillus berkeleyi]MCF6136650.1 hypothetical protein [Pseudalkalibacillus berkeleyi]
MDFINWYDWITPTNPMASIFFGILFTIIIGITVWVESKEVKMLVVTTLTGIAVTLIGVSALTAIGFYT